MGKRAHGEGTAYQRSDGRWAAAMTIGWKDGRQQRKYFYGRSQKEVTDKLADARHSQRVGLPVAPERRTLESWLRTWLEGHKSTVKPKTYENYEGHVRLHLIPELGRKLLSKLQPEDVRAFMRAKAEAGLSPKSIRHCRATLRTALNVAVLDGVVHRNVATLTKPPRLDRKPLRVFSVEEARLFLAIVKGHRLEALFTMALSIGLREGEALGLRWEDIDFERSKLRVERVLQRVKIASGDGKRKTALVLLDEPKSKRSRRTIPLPAVALAALRAHREKQEADRLLCGSKWRDEGLVFTTSVGAMLDPRNMLRCFYAIMNTRDPNDSEPDTKKRRHLLPRIRFHDLRHSLVSLLLAQGVHMRFIMELLGHSSISVTMDTYGHLLDPVMALETAGKTDALLKPNSCQDSGQKSEGS